MGRCLGSFILHTLPPPYLLKHHTLTKKCFPGNIAIELPRINDLARLVSFFFSFFLIRGSQEGVEVPVLVWDRDSFSESYPQVTNRLFVIGKPLLPVTGLVVGKLWTVCA